MVFCFHDLDMGSRNSFRMVKNSKSVYRLDLIAFR